MIVSIINRARHTSRAFEYHHTFLDYSTMVQKDEAVRRLRTAELNEIANELEAWRDINGNNWGWDGWIRSAHPNAVAIIWPDE